MGPCGAYIRKKSIHGHQNILLIYFVLYWDLVSRNKVWPKLYPSYSLQVWFSDRIQRNNNIIWNKCFIFSRNWSFDKFSAVKCKTCVEGRTWVKQKLPGTSHCRYQYFCWVFLCISEYWSIRTYFSNMRGIVSVILHFRNVLTIKKLKYWNYYGRWSWMHSPPSA